MIITTPFAPAFPLIDFTYQ